MALSDLFKAATKEDFLKSLLTIAKVAGFPVESWQPRNDARATLAVVAEAISNLWASISGLASSGFLAYAEGDWLELHTEDFYELTRDAATRATRTCVVTNSGATPVSWDIGTVLFRIAGTEIFFSNTTGVALLNPGDSTTLTFQSTDFGTSQNSPETQVISSSGPATSELSNCIVVTSARDEESDQELRDRCREKWGLITKGTDDWYVATAKAFNPLIKKVRVRRSYPNPGDTTVCIAGASGALSSSIATSLENYLDPKPDHNGVAGWGDNTYAVSASNYVVAISANVYVRVEEIDAARASALNALQALTESTEIGGVIRRNDVIDCFMQSFSRNSKNKLVLSNPSLGEVTLAADQVLVFDTTSIGWFSV